ncbi:MAG: DUF3574 domain-containing protein [Proteobacteria bacterium]|nr:DUF3574 domain-containing protein [Pseudomonadota bacterium]
MGLTVALALLAGCSTPRAWPGLALACGAGEHRAEVAELYLGRNIGDRLGVSDEDFRRFLDEELTPRFPDGLSVIDAQGQWRGKAGLVREPSKLVVIVLPGKPDDRARLAAAAEAYKARFRQEAVLTLVSQACARF